MSDGPLTNFLRRLFRKSRETGGTVLPRSLIPAREWFAAERRRVAPQLEREAWQRELRAWYAQEHRDDQW